MSAFRLEELTYRISADFTLGPLTLELPTGSLTALIGPNGSGKTTLVRLMTGLLKSRQGAVLLDGSPLDDFSVKDRARKIAVIASEQFFEFPFTVEEIVSMGRYPHRRRFQRLTKEDRKIIRESMEMTQTEQLRERIISELSSGERQRVFIARAIAQQPAILVLDEPSAHLDINHQIAIFRLLQDLNRRHGVTVVVVIHDLTAAATFFKTLILLHQGRIFAMGTPAEVITAEHIRRTYSAEVLVYPSPSGGAPQIAYRAAPQAAEKVDKNRPSELTHTYEK